MFRIQRLVRPRARPRASSVAVAALTIAVACAALAARAQVVPEVRAGTEALAFDLDSCARPQWPADSLRNGEEGTVTAEFLVGTDGQVKNARITRSAGFRDLDKAVLVAFLSCRTKTAPAQDTWLPLEYAWRAGAAEHAALAAQGVALSNQAVNPQRPTVDFNSCPRPVYPPAALRERRQGKVSLKFLVDPDGRATDSVIVASSGSQDLDEAAATSLSQCHFNPTIRDGQPVADWKPLQYVWTLE